VKRGSGKIVEIDGTKAAASRSEKGAVTLLSPVRTHLRRLVGRNPAEAEPIPESRTQR
jgi:hypothetical protein